MALGKSFDRVTKKAGKPLYPRYIKERIVLETVFFYLVFLQPTCRHTFIFGLHLFVGSMQCYCAVLDYARKSKRETDKENSFIQFCIAFLSISVPNRMLALII